MGVLIGLTFSEKGEFDDLPVLETVSPHEFEGNGDAGDVGAVDALDGEDTHKRVGRINRHSHLHKSGFSDVLL